MAVGYVPAFRLVSQDSARFFEAGLGEAAAVVSGGYGGWEVTQRPRSTSMTDWKGKDPIQLTIPFMLDQLESGNAFLVERQIGILEGFAGLDPTEDEPPPVQLQSNGVIPHDNLQNAHRRWVVTAVDWDASSVIRIPSGRMRQAGTITLLEYVEPDTIQVNRSPAQKKRAKTKKKASGGKKGAKDKTYNVKSGDTLSKIAARELGSAGRWGEIAKLNNIRDPNRLKVGQRLRLP